MTIPPESGRKSPLTSLSPLSSSVPDTETESPVTDSYEPVTSRTPDKTSDTGLSSRRIGTTPPKALTVNLQAQYARELQQNYLYQRDTVNALRVQKFLLSEIDTLIRQLDNPKAPSAHLPIAVVHVDTTGSMENVIPPSAELLAQPEKLQTFNSEVKQQLQKIDSHYQRSEIKALDRELEQAETTLKGYVLKLQSERIPIPEASPVSKPVSLSRLSRDTRPPYSDESPRPGEYLVDGCPLPNYYDDESYPASPVSPPGSLPLKYESYPTTRLVNEEGEPLPFLKTSMTSPATPAPPGKDAHYLEVLNYHPPFNNWKHKPKCIRERGDNALLLRTLPPDDPLVSASRHGKTHIARKAVLFNVLMNFYKQHKSEEALQISPEVVELIQFGILATDVRQEQLFDRQGAKSEVATCEQILTDTEGVHPEVAKVVAGIVTGTAHQNSLPAKIMRDIERLENMRFEDQFDMESLETTTPYAANGCVKECMSRVASQWRYLLRQQGELDHPAVINNGVKLNPPDGGYQSDSKPEVRTQMNKQEFQFHLQNSELKMLNEPVSYLYELNEYSTPTKQKEVSSKKQD